MKIHELPSQDMETPTNEALKRAEELVREIEEAAPTSLSADSVKKLRNVVAESFAQAEFSEEQRVNAWRLSYRLWNTSVDIVNNLEVDQELTEDHAELRQIASDLLAIAGAIGNTRSSFVRIAMFFYKTGCAWHKIKKYLKASACFERAFELCFKQEGSGSQSSDTTEQVEFYFDLSLARARAAWELGGQTLACSLLGRARGLLPTVPTDRRVELAEQYLQFGKSLLLKDDTGSQAESVRYMETGLDVCSEALSISQLDDVDRTNLERLKQRLLRNLTAGQLQNENYESALRCVDALRLTTDQTSTSYFALRALAKLGRHEEAERELFTLVDHAGERVDLYISALEIVIQECSRIDAVEKAFFILLEQFGPNKEQLPAKVLEKLLRQEPSGDPSCIKRVELALKIACDEKILTALMAENEGLMLGDKRQQSSQKQREFVHALLWTSGSEHFQAKMYKNSIRLFEASMLYVVRDSEGCMLEAKSLRVLCLCHIALSQFERAAEVLDAAEKVDPCIATIFLKFKMGLQSRNETDACKQIERMLKCPDFEPEFLNLACHEAIACKSITVAVSALCSILSLYTSERILATGEVVVLRNLILLLIQEKNRRSDILKYFKYAQKRLHDVGCEKFFGAGSNGEREVKWFSGAAWNEAMECGSEQNWKSCAEFFAISSNFYSQLPKSLGSLQFVQTALLLCVSALLTAVDVKESEVIHIATNYLDKCQKVHEALVALPDSGIKIDESFDIFLNLLLFELKGRAKEDAEQLKILKRCSGIPGFTALQFFKMGLETCKRKEPATEVAVASFRMCLALTLSDPNADYKVVAAVIRKMINLANTRCKDGPEASTRSLSYIRLVIK
ncbi:hypothetical protein KC19_6G058500 [Ceratodon purpureus]|uniref:Protein ZIP4 homolog n=1 Tax=Ceratodon purpureus TaxID=3225 RepID=A0A8T0HDK0_CERPU|nr:hypothetical protein KC19_6G058500 [Ceratodon purpureus]